MLAESLKMDNSTHDRITWSDREWDMLAIELKRQHPKRMESSAFRLDFTTLELEDAAEAVIPQHLQRSFASFDEVRRPLFNAFERLKPNAKNVVHVSEGATRKDGAIYWSPKEWEAIAHELESMMPGVFDRRCNGVGIKEVNAAQRILPINRRRIFKQVVGFRASILKTWEHILAARKDLAPAVIVDFPSGPIMEPPPRKADDNSAIATAIHKAFQAGPTAKKPRKSKVHWTAEEWLILAKEMRRQNPHYDFFNAKFHLVDLAAVREAQRQALPLLRRRNITTGKNLGEPLVAAFKALADELKQEEEAAIDLAPAEEIAEVQDKQPEPEPLPVATVIPLENRPIQAVQEFSALVSQTAQPLMELLVSEIVKRLLPELTAKLVPEISASISGIVQTALAGFKPSPVRFEAAPAPVVSSVVDSLPVASPEPVQRLSHKEAAAFFPPPEPKPKKPKIVLLGPTGRQKNDIEMTFPDYRFVFIEHGHGIKEAAVDCELFIIYTSHFNAANKMAVKKYVPPEKVRQVAGSISSVKHQINTWNAANQLAKAH